jgi:hypothetical protein
MHWNFDHPNDEIGDLAATINGMLFHLERTLARLEETLNRQRRFVALYRYKE